MKLLTLETAKNAKTAKLNILTGVLLLSPHKESGCMNTCPYADGCEKACLNTSGRLKFDSAREARIRRTKWFKNDRPGFLAALRSDIEALCRKAAREDKQPAVRPNGLSDLRWEKIDPELFLDFPEVQFYDYTKDWDRYKNWLVGQKNDWERYKNWLVGRKRGAEDRWFPLNYHLTYSAGESTTDQEIEFLLGAGGTVAMVFHEPPRSILLAGNFCAEVIDGDAHDARWLDPTGVVVGLKAKGEARKLDTAFVN